MRLTGEPEIAGYNTVSRGDAVRDSRRAYGRAEQRGASLAIGNIPLTDWRELVQGSGTSPIFYLWGGDDPR